MGVMVISEDVRGDAEISYGDKKGQEKARSLLRELGFPSGLFQLREILEIGHVKETGLVWIKQKRRVDHYFEKIERTVSFGTEMMAFVEKGKVKVVSGIKAKELMVWVNVCEMLIDGPPTSGDLTCKALLGFYRTFPASAFLEP